MELVPVLPFLKITHSLAFSGSFDYAALSSFRATLLPNCDSNNTPFLVFLAGGGKNFYSLSVSASQSII